MFRPSDTSITSVRFGIPAQQVGLVLDNVSLGTADPLNPIPEPGTALLLIAGGAAMGVVSRSKRTLNQQADSPGVCVSRAAMRQASCWSGDL